MDPRRQHHGMQSQQFPPLLHSQGGGHPPRLPLPLPHPHMGFGPRPNSFSGPLSGQKRSSRSSDNGGSSKLFVAGLPRNISEDEVRGLFDGFGNVLEVIFLKDKKTGLPQGCCFIKYATITEAERAIRALDNQRPLSGVPAPLQVKFADGERDHSGPSEYKLFVGSLSRQANEQEIEEIFAPYGRVENVYLIRDEQKQSRGCAFVTFPERDMAIAAISALNGVYRMAGSHQPIIVRFADPKRPRSQERETNRSGPNYSPRSHQGGMGPNYNSHSYQGAGGPRGSGGPALEAQGPTFGWRQGGTTSGMGLIPQGGILPLGAAPASLARRGPSEGPNATMGVRGGALSSQPTAALPGQSAVSGMGPQLSQQQGFKESPLNKPGQALGQHFPMHQPPLQQSLPGTPKHNQVQPPLQGFPMTQSIDTRTQQHVPVGQYTSSQPTLPIYGQASVPHQQMQQQLVTSMQQPSATLPSQQIHFQPLHQQDSQPNQQSVGVQTPQPLQQLHQLLPVQQPLQSQIQPQIVVKETAQQTSWSVPVQQQAIPPVATTSAASVSATPAPTIARCEWTEHTSPEGHKYYYNSTTGESRWEKPHEFAVFEQQQQLQPQLQQPQLHQQPQPQLQLPHAQQPQQAQPHLQQQALVQSQVQPHVQQLHPQQQSNHQYQQQPLLSHQPQQLVQQHYQQPQLQQLPHQTSLQQPQPQQLPQQLQFQQLQQPQPQQLQQPQPQHMQQPPPQLHQAQAETQYSSSAMQFTQLPSGVASYQTVQMRPLVQPANGIAEPSRGSQSQQFAPNQQISVANGVPDPAKVPQWMPAMQQGMPNQDWMWKTKPTGS